MIELCSHLVTEEPSGPTGTDCPGFDVFGVAPDEITEGAFMGNFLGPGNDADLVDGSDLGRQAAMDAEHGTVDDSGKHKEIKDLTAGLPDGRVSVLLLTLFVEAINLSDLTRLMVASDQYYPVRVSGSHGLASSGGVSCHSIILTWLSST